MTIAQLTRGMVSPLGGSVLSTDADIKSQIDSIILNVTTRNKAIVKGNIVKTGVQGQVDNKQSVTGSVGDD